MKINQVNIVNQKVDKNQVRQLILNLISDRYWNVIPKSNLIFFPKNQVAAELVRQFHFIKQVDIQRVFPTAILVTVQERESMMIWCAKGDCFLVDETGDAFYKLMTTDPELRNNQLIKVEDKSQKDVKIGWEIIKPALVQYCLNLPEAIHRQLGIEILKEYTTPSSMSGEMKIKTVSGWEIFFNTNDLLDNQLNILKEVLSNQIGQDRIDQIEYIDLRLRGRVTYRLKNQPEETQTDSAQNSSETKVDEQPTAPIEPVVQPDPVKDKKKKKG